MVIKRLALSCAAFLVFACGRDSKPSPSQASSSAGAAPAEKSPTPAASGPTPNGSPPKRLTSLPLSAYATSLAMDDDAVYLLTSHAAYRLVDGEPAHGIGLELGIGPVLTRSSFVFWSNGIIWSAPKEGGVTRELAKFPHQPQYFVGYEDAFAWVDQAEDGLYTIQTLDKRKPRVLVSSTGELRALDMVGNAVYFVQRPADDSWRIGSVRLDGGAVDYGTTRKGRAPSQLAGLDGVYYYDLDTTRIMKATLDLRHEEVQSKELVCSPIHVSNRIYCGCVEGLFDVTKDTHQPRVLVYNRPGSITNVTSNSKAVAWVVDVGADQLAVDMLPVSEGEAQSPVP